MCGRFRQEASQDGLTGWGEDLIPPEEDITPGTYATVLSRGGAERLCFGVRPPWDPRGRLLVNARSETVGRLRTWREAARGRRCAVPMSQWSEWDARTRRRWWVRPHGRAYAAGICTGGGFVVLTLPACPELARVHHRQPALLRANPRDWTHAGGLDEALGELTDRPGGGFELTASPA